jgi:hypothetical protein
MRRNDGSSEIHVKLVISSKSQEIAQSRRDAEKEQYLRASASLRENINGDIAGIRVEPKRFAGLGLHGNENQKSFG